MTSSVRRHGTPEPAPVFRVPGGVPDSHLWAQEGGLDVPAGPGGEGGVGGRPGGVPHQCKFNWDGVETVAVNFLDVVFDIFSSFFSSGPSA